MELALWLSLVDFPVGKRIHRKEHWPVFGLLLQVKTGVW